MKSELDYLKEVITFSENEKEIFDAFIESNGIDKSKDVFHNYQRLTNKDKVSIIDLLAFLQYEYSLSTVLFSVLRIQEDAVKAFLCNTFNNVKVEIHSKPSNYSKVKYYFEIPVRYGQYIDIRTFNYERGPVDYYDAIKTMDFGDINLIMSKLDKDVLRRFSKNPNILTELDMTRKIRNYVYHHNLLFSFQKDDLTQGIAFALKNLPLQIEKEEYIKIINNLRYQSGKRKGDIGEKIAIYIDDDLAKQILQDR